MPNSRRLLHESARVSGHSPAVFFCFFFKIRERPGVSLSGMAYNGVPQRMGLYDAGQGLVATTTYTGRGGGVRGQRKSVCL